MPAQARPCGHAGRSKVPVQDPDARLVEQTRAGDRAAAEELYRRYERRAYNLALRMVGNPWDAADITQEAFLKAFTALKDFRTEARFGTWLHRIVLNTSYDHLRRRRPEPTEPESLERATEAFAGRNQPPREPAETDHLPEPLRAALLALPEGFRLAVVLCDLLGFGYAEAAEILEVQEGTIKSRLFRARALLARDLQARGYLEGEARNVPEGPAVKDDANGQIALDTQDG